MTVTDIQDTDSIDTLIGALTELRDGDMASIGRLAALGKALESMGKGMLDSARNVALSKLETDGERFLVMDDVRFERVAGSRSLQLDSREVRRQFPPALHPDFYREQVRVPHVVVRVGKETAASEGR